jgi:hypothetical protein
MDTIKLKGKMYLAYNCGNITCLMVSFHELASERDKEDYIYDLMSGKEFYESVDDGGFIDYDGSIAAIYIDGYKSNLGLFHKGINQGSFMVDGDTFLELCDEHDIQVNWANK